MSMVAPNHRNGSEFGSLPSLSPDRQAALLAAFRERLADWSVCEARTISAWADAGLCVHAVTVARARAATVLEEVQRREQRARQAAGEERRAAAARRRRDELTANARNRMQAKARAAQRARGGTAQAQASSQQTRSHTPLPRAPSRPSTGQASRRPQPPQVPRPAQPVARRVHFTAGDDGLGSADSSNADSDRGEEQRRGLPPTEKTLPPTAASTTSAARLSTPESSATSLHSSLDRGEDDDDLAAAEDPAGSFAVLRFGRARWSSGSTTRLTPSAVSLAIAAAVTVAPRPASLHEIPVPPAGSSPVASITAVAVDDSAVDSPAPANADTTGVFRSPLRTSASQSATPPSKLASSRRSLQRHLRQQQQSSGTCEPSALMLSPIPAADREVDDLSSASSNFD